MSIIRTIAATACFLVCLGSLGYVAAGASGLPVPPVHCLDSYAAIVGSVALWFAVMIAGMCLTANPD